MSWLFSRALVAEFSAGTCSAGEPSAQLNVMPTQHPFWRNDKTMEPSRLSRFGLTCAALTAGRGEELLMSYLAAFRVRTSASQDVAPDWRALVAGSGANMPASWARFDPATSTLKTAQNSFLEDSTLSSLILPRSGLMLDGACYQLPPLARPTSANASGFWPTPTASLGSKGGRVTPRKGREGGTLIEAVSARMYPTPTATAHKGWSKNHNRAATDDRIDYTIEREASQAGQSGRLNPPWVEWLMGWPIGWTESAPLEMDKFREWQQQHGNF